MNLGHIKFQMHITIMYIQYSYTARIVLKYSLISMSTLCATWHKHEEAHSFLWQRQSWEWALWVPEDIMALADATQCEIYVSHGARRGKRHILHFYHIENKNCINCILSDFGQSETLLKCGPAPIALSVLSCSIVIPVLGSQVTLMVHWTWQLWVLSQRAMCFWRVRHFFCP